jgi:hypothetical protein
MQETIEQDDVTTVMASLETAAGAGDLSDAFYAAYEARCAESAEVMAHMDATMRGRMLAGLHDLLLIPGAEEQARYMAFELGNHEAYGAKPHMYAPLFEALHATVREACGEAWTDDFEAAWRRRTEALLGEVEARA